MAIRAVFTDIDDTIIRAGKEPSEKLKATIKELAKADILFIPITGRPFMSLINLAKELNLKDYLCGYNGALAYNLKDEEVFISNPINQKTQRELIDELIKLKLNFIVFDEETKKLKTLDDEEEYANYEANLNDLPLEKVTIEEIKKVNTHKILAFSKPRMIEEYIEKLEEKFTDAYQFLMSKPFFIEINNKAVTKGGCVKLICEKLGIKEDEILCFGDSMNDYDMIKNFPKTVAVSNAHPSIQEVATWTTKSVDEDGESYFISRHIFHNYVEE